MELEDETDELIPAPRELLIGQLRSKFGPEQDRAGVGVVEQAKYIYERALAASGRAHDRVSGPRRYVQRDAAERVDARFVFAQIALDSFTTQRSTRDHTLEPRKVTTGGSAAARRAGT